MCTGPHAVFECISRVVYGECLPLATQATIYSTSYGTSYLLMYFYRSREWYQGDVACAAAIVGFAAHEQHVVQA